MDKICKLTTSLEKAFLDKSKIQNTPNFQHNILKIQSLQLKFYLN